MTSMKPIPPAPLPPKRARLSSQAESSSHWGWMVAGLAASIAFHGMVLGLPGWHPPTPAPSSPDRAPSGSGSGGAIEVTRLPKLTPQPSATSAPETLPPQPSETAFPLASTNAPEEVPPLPLSTDARDMVEETVVPPPTPEAVEPDPSAPVAADPPFLSDLPEEAGLASLQPDTTPPTLEARLQDLTAYGYDGSKVLKAGDMALPLQTWTGEGQFFPTKADPLIVPYDLGDLCLETPPTFGVLAVILAADGTPQRGPTLISSTGYPILDEKAQAMILAGEHPFPDRTEPVGYSLEVQVAYPEACR